MSDQPVVHVIDDDAPLRIELMGVLGAAGYQVLGYASVQEVLAPRRPLASPGCVVLDVSFPVFGGLQLQRAFARWDEPPQVVFVADSPDVPTIVRAMRAGAVDVLTKPVAPQALLAAVASAVQLDAQCHAKRQHERQLEALYMGLTRREKAVFDRVVQGSLNKQIAADLGVAERTVKSHRAHMMEKLEARSVADLVRIAHDLTAVGDARRGARDQH